ncbi:MAG: peptidyl-tRNA hydrolase Pth2 [Thaumarchaeota archaeon]|nr:peptidyl-tRNA hydrolase Pth2 [Nitrososphaerota archaeon]
MAEIKQVMVVRTDLEMGKGKIAAQVAHAALESAEEGMRRQASWYQEWKAQGQAKVVLKASGDAQLHELFKKARSMGLPSSLIQDAGRTQLEPGTVTCLAIGPAPVELIDKITGQLKLL